MTEKAHEQRWTIWGLRIIGHLTGVATILAILALMFVNEDMMKAVDYAAMDPQFQDMVSAPLLLQVGLAACMWALIVIAYEWVRLTVRERRGQLKVALRKSTGTVLTETLIILPIFLLLTSGLAQLAINSSASVLMAVGTFQAGRTAWLWEPETRPDNARNGMSGRQGLVEDHARLAAASVLAPVVPADFRGSCEPAGGSRLDQRLRAFGYAGSYAGIGGLDAVRALTTAQEEGHHDSLVYNIAFDGSAFAERGAKKLFLAYCMTGATYTVGGGDITTTVTYNHKNVFPWFAYIFGQPKMVAGSFGYYSEYTNSYSLPTQIDANPREPLSLGATISDAIDKVIGGLTP